MIRRHNAALRVALMGADFVSAVALFVVIASLRFSDRAWEQVIGQTAVGPWFAAATYAGIWVTILWLRGLYRVRTRWSLRREAVDVLGSVVVLAVVTFAVLFLFRLPDVSRLFLFALFPAQGGLTLLSRLALRGAFARVRARGGNASFMVVVGVNSAAEEFADRVEAHRELGLRVVGHLAEEGAELDAVSRPILGRLEEIEDVLHERIVDEVAICLPWQSWSLIEATTQLCEEEGKIVRIPMGSLGALERGLVEEFEGGQVLSLAYGPDRALGLLLKRVLDVGVSALALVALSPVFVACALWVRMTDGPPVLFRQQRVGLHGRTFTLLKFRTMVADAEERLGELEAHNEINGWAFKVSNDPRVTRTGAFLRRTSLDELPQLWNVLRGEMSLVGPRPPLPAEVAGYDIWHRRRLSMKPGITGLWQVRGRREPEFDRWVEMDLEYIDRWSLWLDLQIMLRTIPAVFQQQGR